MDLKNLPDILAEILKLGPQNLVGIDIGLSSVRVCEMQQIKKGQFRLQKYAAVALPEGCLVEDEIQKPDEIINGIKEAMKAAGIKTKNACIGLFGPNTMSKRLQLAVTSPQEVEDQVMWESEQYIPFGVDESSISFHIIGQNAGGGTDVLVAAARNDIINAYKGIVESIGLKVKVVDLSIFALCNVFEVVIKEQLEANPSEVIIVINIGSQITGLFIYKLDSIIFSREMNIGGDMITEEIQRQMGLNHAEAEDLKTMGDASGKIPEEIVEIIQVVSESFYEEIKKTVDFFITASAEENISKCYITGGTSQVPGIVEGLQQTLGINVELLKPFDKIAFNEKAFPPEILQHISSKGCVAMGLAMRELGQ